MAVWETVRPWGTLTSSSERRWANHGALLALCTVFSVGILRVSPVVASLLFAGNHFGILNKGWSPFWLRCAITVLLLDFVKYGVHWLYHAVPWLWRVHQVHHSDPDYDVSTALRAHPIEVLFTQACYIAVIALTAAPPLGVLIAELMSCIQSFTGHVNASVPHWADRVVRTVFITPNMHRIHHSEEMAEQRGNLGEIFPWWDRLLGTYVDAPKAGDERLVVGLKGFQDPGSLGLRFMLTSPFRKESGELAGAEGEEMQPTVPS